MKSPSRIISVIAFASLFLAACSAAPDGDAASDEESPIKASEICEAVSPTYRGAAVVTASTSRLRCYDDEGALHDRFPPNASVLILEGPTESGANQERFKISGRSSSEAPIECWVSKDYLCERGGAASGVLELSCTYGETRIVRGQCVENADGWHRCKIDRGLAKIVQDSTCASEAAIRMDGECGGGAKVIGKDMNEQVCFGDDTWFNFNRETSLEVNKDLPWVKACTAAGGGVRYNSDGWNDWCECVCAE